MAFLRMSDAVTRQSHSDEKEEPDHPPPRQDQSQAVKDARPPQSSIDHSNDNIEMRPSSSSSILHFRPTIIHAWQQSFRLIFHILWSVLIYSRKITNTLLFAEPSTVLKQRGGQRKCLAYTLDFSISETKSIGRHFSATLNDVLISCIAGALRHSMEDISNVPVPPSLHLRAGIPVNMRPSINHVTTTSNDFSSLLVSLPVGEVDPATRMRMIVQRMKEAKFSMEKTFTQWLSHCMMAMPLAWMRTCVHWSTSRVTIAITNVRGPTSVNAWTFCGCPIVASVAFVPPPPSVNIGVAITSWGEDALGVTVLTDASIPCPPEKIIEWIRAEYQALQATIPS